MDHIVARREGQVGRLTLARPAALNALDLPMIRALSAALVSWRGDPAVHAVVIDAEGKAFCAGGDVRALRAAALAGDADTIETFFAEEYALDLLIAEYPVPVVSLIDGVCMGGGIGISVHGPYRVATEHALFAMPETGIALFPDVGASYVLPRLPGALGFYLGLTGARLAGADAVHAGLATHFVSRARLPVLAAAVVADGVAALAAFAEPLPAFSLAGERAAIDRCFGLSSVAAIRAALAGEGAFGARALAALDGASPSALAWTFGLLRAGTARTLRECFAAELRLTRGVTQHPDFAEGVRAMVVDKDRRPVWAPAVGEGALAGLLG